MELLMVRRSPLAREHITLLALTAFLFLFHLWANAFTSYGFFRDEFYYLACSRRLSWGYVDQPPLSIFILALNRTLLGDSLFAIRFPPALALASTVLFTGLIVRRLNGGMLALLLACLSVVVAPILLAMGTFYSMNSFDILLWAVAAYVLVLIIDHPKPAYWILLGVVLGIGLLNKVGFLWLGAGLLAGLLVTPLRKHLLTPWPYLSALIACLLFTPYVIWNFQHDFAHIEFIRNAVAYKYAGLTRIDFILGQILLPNPATMPVWLGGLYFYFFHSNGKKYRTLGMLFLATFIILMVNGHSKPEYLASAYPILFAGGGVLMEKLVAERNWQWLKYVLLPALLISGIVLAPLAMPLLPVRAYISYAATLGFGPTSSEGKQMAELPQFFADMFGWESLAADVSQVYLSLPEEEREATVVFTQNYGEAGALEYYSDQYALPAVISGHNTYWLWGYGQRTPKVVMVVGGEQQDHQQIFKQVEQVSIHHAEYAMPYEDNLPIFVCRKPTHPLNDIWVHTKHYN